MTFSAQIFDGLDRHQVTLSETEQGAIAGMVDGLVIALARHQVTLLSILQDLDPDLSTEAAIARMSEVVDIKSDQHRALVVGLMNSISEQLIEASELSHLLE